LVEESGVVMQTDNENKKLEEARNIIIDALGRVYALYGLPQGQLPRFDSCQPQNP
jgi:hypothetical protein